jgi:hypothetical protein
MTRYGHLTGPGEDRVAQMRAEFDAGFAGVPQSDGADLTDVLALRMGDAEILLRLADIGELIARPALTRVPSTSPALIGLTASHDRPLAAYDLATLLGQAPGRPRWLVIVAAEPGVGLAFEHFGGYRRIPLAPGHAHRLVEVAGLVEEIRSLSPSPMPVADHRSLLESRS